MKTISGGFSSAGNGKSLAAAALGLQTISEYEMDDKEAAVLDELKKGRSPQEIAHSTGYGYAYTLGVEIRHRDEIKNAAADREDRILKSAEAIAAAEEEARIRRLVSSGTIPLSALEPYEKKEEKAVDIQQDLLEEIGDVVEDLKK